MRLLDQATVLLSLLLAISTVSCCRQQLVPHDTSPTAKAKASEVFSINLPRFDDPNVLLYVTSVGVSSNGTITHQRREATDRAILGASEYLAISITSQHLSDSLVAQLCSCNRLIRLQLTECSGYTPDCLSHVQPALDLAYLHIAGGAPLSRLSIESLNKHPRLRNLSLQGISLTGNNDSTTFESLAQLDSLSMGGVEPYAAIDELTLVLSPALRSLTLSMCKFKGLNLEAPFLSTLSIEDNPSMSDCSRIRSTSPNFHSLRMTNCAKADPSSLLLLTSRPQLRELELHNMKKLGVGESAFLSKGLTELRRLVWRSAAEDLESVFEAIRQLRSLADLTVSFGGHSIKDLGGLISMPSLRDVTLEELEEEPTGFTANWVNSPVEQMKFFRSSIRPQMLEAIRCMRALKSLELVECSGFSPKGDGLAVEVLAIHDSWNSMEALRGWLKRCPNLRELHVSGVVCKSEDFSSLVARTKLHTLSLSNCGLTDECLLQAEEFGFLKYLGLQWNKEISIMAVAHILEKSNVLKVELFGTAVQPLEARDLATTYQNVIIDY
jgi:hypothetical protein